MTSVVYIISETEISSSIFSQMAMASNFRKKHICLLISNVTENVENLLNWEFPLKRILMKNELKFGGSISNVPLKSALYILAVANSSECPLGYN